MFDLKNSGFCSILFNLCKLILGYLKILLDFKYFILLILLPFFLIGYCIYHIIAEEVTHDLRLINIL